MAESARKLSRIIDVHSHIVVDFGTGVDVGTGFPLDMSPPWSVESALALMDANGIACSMLSVPDGAAREEGAAARETARRINERLAGIVARHPSRFGALATLPCRDMDDTLREMAHALDVLKFDGVAAPTSVKDVYLGQAQFDPWFQEMHRRGVTLFVHPVMAEASRPLALGLNQSVLEFMFDTTRMLVNMVLSGAKQRFSNIRIISTHGGGTVPYLVRRLQILEESMGAGPGRARMSAQALKDGLASFHYDLTASTSPAQLHALQQLVPPSRLLMGFDNPFMPAATFGAAIAEVEGWAGFGADDLPLLAHGNAAQLFPQLLQRLCPA